MGYAAYPPEGDPSQSLHPPKSQLPLKNKRISAGRSVVWDQKRGGGAPAAGSASVSIDFPQKYIIGGVRHGDQFPDCVACPRERASPGIDPLDRDHIDELTAGRLALKL